MALNFLSNSGVNGVKVFEIRLDSKNLILRGSEHEASSTILKGSLVLILSEPLKVQNIRMELTGVSKLDWTILSGTQNGRHIKQESEFFREDWSFVGRAGKNAHVMPAGNYEWLFELLIPGDTPESVEGLPRSWVIYRMKAIVERSGILQKDLHTRRHVRIIRTFDTSALELAHAMSVENVWPDKIQYAINIPMKGVIFGTPIAVEFTLIPLLKGLRIGRITTELVESQEFTIDQSGPAQDHNQHKVTRVVAENVFTLPPGTESQDIDGQEGFMIVRNVRIPKNLGKCLQSVDSKGIKVRHKLRFNVQLHNPDEHVSELRATLPVHIFISPNLPLDDNNNMIDQSPQAIQAVEELSSAPPLYGEHHFDQLYSAVDPSGYITPGASTETPFSSRSRATSRSRVSSATDVASMDSNRLSANVLQNRLHNLQNGAPISSREQHHLSDGTMASRSTISEAAEDDMARPNRLSSFRNFQQSIPPDRPPPAVPESGHDAEYMNDMRSNSIVEPSPEENMLRPNNRSAIHAPGLPRSVRDQDALPQIGSSARNSSMGEALSGDLRQSRSSSLSRSGTNGNPISRIHSEEEPMPSGAQTPVHVEFNRQDLCRVPSYTTAIQTPARTLISEELPNYQAATSSPPNPPPPSSAAPANTPGFDHHHTDNCACLGGGSSINNFLPIRPSPSDQREMEGREENDKRSRLAQFIGRHSST